MGKIHEEGNGEEFTVRFFVAYTIIWCSIYEADTKKFLICKTVILTTYFTEFVYILAKTFKMKQSLCFRAILLAEEQFKGITSG
jgi:hypothetical protein